MCLALAIVGQVCFKQYNKTFNPVLKPSRTFVIGSLVFGTILDIGGLIALAYYASKSNLFNKPVSTYNLQDIAIMTGGGLEASLLLVSLIGVQCSSTFIPKAKKAKV